MASYRLDTLQGIWLAENINRQVPRNNSTITVQRPNNSIRVADIINDLIELDPTIHSTINNIVLPTFDDTIYTANGTLTGDRTLLGGGYNLTFNVTSESDSSIQRWTPAFTDIKVSSAVSNSELYLSPTLSHIKNYIGNDDSGIETTPTYTIVYSVDGTNQSRIVTSPTSINLVQVGADLRLNADPGLPSQVLTSNGPGMPPTWTTVAGAGTITANNGLTATGSTNIKLGGTLVEPTTITGSAVNTFQTNFTNGTNIADTYSSPLVLRSRITTGVTITSAQVSPSAVTLSATDGSTVSLIDANITYIDLVSNRVNYRHTRNLKVDIVSTSYTIVEGDQLIVVAPDPGNSVTITLPASPNTGDTYTIKNKDLDGTMSVTIDGNGNTMDGVATMPYDVPYQSFDFIYDGIEWSVY